MRFGLFPLEAGDWAAGSAWPEDRDACSAVVPFVARVGFVALVSVVAFGLPVPFSLGAALDVAAWRSSARFLPVGFALRFAAAVPFAARVGLDFVGAATTDSRPATGG